MSLAKEHYLPRKTDREKKWYHPIYQYGSHSQKEYNRIEALLDEITCDVVNGVSTSEILLYLQSGDRYENQKKPLSPVTANSYIDAVRSRLALDRNRDSEQVKDAIYSQYLQIYRESMENGNLMMAKSTLDSLVKLYGFDKAPTTAVQINNSSDGVTINFGFEKKKEKE